MSISPSINAVAGLLAGATLSAFASAPHAAVTPQADQQATVRSIRVVDDRGHTTAYFGNIADGESPALLLYDRRGRLCSGVMVDSVTGQSAPLVMASGSAGQTGTSDLRVKGLARRKRLHAAVRTRTPCRPYAPRLSRHGGGF